MKIENKETSLTDDSGKKLSYADVLILTVNGEVKHGMDIQEMRKRVDLIEALDKSEEFVELDEEQTVLLRGLWATHRWKAPHPDILKVDEAIAK